MTKILLVSAAITLIVLSVCLPAADARWKSRHSITKGRHSWEDTLLIHEVVKKSGSWFPYPKVKVQNVCYPDDGSSDSGYTITSYKVTDLAPKGEGGHFYIKKGGIGSDRICIHLKTYRGKGFHFKVDIWGHKKAGWHKKHKGFFSSIFGK